MKAITGVMLAENGTKRVPESEKAVVVRDVINEYHSSLIHFLQRKLPTPEDAFDVAQEAYIRLMNYEGSREVMSPSSLLFRIAINIANDLGRAGKVRRVADHCDIDGLEFDSGIPSPEREVAASQELDLLYQAIEQLPPKCQRVFLLSRVNNLTYPQIAEHCGISVKMVEKHISRALAICTEKTVV